MKIYKLSITVVRANPQIMREIWISSAYTMRELTMVVCILLGLGKKKGEYPKNKDLKDEIRLEEIFPEQDAVYIRVKDEYGEKKNVLIDVQFLEERETEEPLLFPKISAYRGEKLLDGSCDLAAHNRNCLRMIEDGTENVWNHFSPARTEAALRRMFAPQTLPNQLQERYTLPIVNLIGSLKLQELKDAIECSGSGIYLYQKKADLQKQYVEELQDPDSIDRVLTERMDEEEFRDMRSFLMTGDILREDMPIEYALHFLADCGLLCMVKGEWKLAREIYDFYRPWFGTKKEALFMARKCYSVLFKGGLRLYGIVTKKIMKNLLAFCYPEENIEGYFEDFWKEAAAGKLDPQIQAVGKEHLFYAKDLNPKFALEMTQEKAFFEERYYYPNVRELRDIAAHGLEFQEEGLLVEFCRRRLYLSENRTGQVLREAARCCHLGLEPEFIADKICEEAYGYGRQYMKRDCVKILEEMYGDIRSFELHGFTENEVRGGYSR